MTDEIAERNAEDGTFESLPPAIAQLGIEARAEYVRARQRLGLSETPSSRLGLVGRYRLEAEIGRGGMGVVYRAHDPELDRSIAIKLVQAKPFAGPDRLRSRLLREAKVLAKLTHANVVRVYDCGEHEGEVYLAMEFVEGQTLRQWQQGQSRRSIVDAYERAARGLAAAHEMGITHRDFKPDNVLVASDGRVLVGDFGLAGLGGAGDEREESRSPLVGPVIGWVSETRTGTILGTPMYMSPEQFRGETATARSDQFSFCVSLWEALTGKRPFDAEGGEALLEQIEQGALVGASKVPRRLRSVLTRGLSEDPDDRFVEVEVLADALRPRRGVVPGTILVLSLATGWLAGGGLSERVESPSVEPVPVERECPRVDRIDAIKEMPAWAELEDKLGDDAAYGQLKARVEKLRNKAEDGCQSEIIDGPLSSKEQHLDGFIDSLDDIVTKSGEFSQEELLRAVGGFSESSWREQPPRLLDADVMRTLRGAELHAIRGELDEAFAATEQAVVHTKGEPLELALVGRWRGRILALRGQHEASMETYLDAFADAEDARYEDARLDVMLLMAKTAAMRLGDRQRADDFLTFAWGIMRRIGQQWDSPRRADYHEIQASVLKLQGEGVCDFEAALAHQRHALLIHYWNGDVAKKGMGHLNLARVYEICRPESESEPEPDQVRIHLEQALKILEVMPSSPERKQAAFGLGHWLLAKYGEKDWPYAKVLLEEARQSRDMEMYALIDLVMLAILVDEDPASSLGLALVLRKKVLLESSSLAGKRLDAWNNIAVAFALNEDLEAFEDARGFFGREAQVQRALHEYEPKKLEQIALDAAGLDLTAAQFLIDHEPKRARELLMAARAVLEPLSASTDRTAMLGQINELSL